MTKDFWIISLCNVVFKFFMKLVASWLQPLMAYLINPIQTSFIPGQIIHDNILIVYEFIHTMWIS